MKFTDICVDQLTIELSRDELLIISAALNEVCNGIELFEFDTRMGASHEKAIDLLRDFGQIIYLMETRL